MHSLTAPLASRMPARWREPADWIRAADVFAALTLISLPWSTSFPAIFAGIWVVVLLPAVDWRAFGELLRRPVCYLPLAMVALAALGMLWSEAPWAARTYALRPVGKFLMLPLIVYHFQHSKRGPLIFISFLVSCALLMLLSFLVAYDPRFALKSVNEFTGDLYGVPVKNYIDQSQEFALCIVALAWPILACIKARRFGMAALLGVVALGFLVNMMFVTVSRTALVSLPVMLLLFAWKHLTRRGMALVLAGCVAAVALLWVVSPNLRAKLDTIGAEYERYQTSTERTSGGLRLEFWRKSLQFFAEAPVFGHGTGATRTLFEQAAVNQTGVGAEVIGNPHNQTLNNAVQWGLVGVALLYAMWIAHLLLFRGEGVVAWIGLLVVVQNMFSSLFNSHLFDFHEGWMYVLGVGIAGGMMLRAGGVPSKC